jgi:hypothetical protein
VKQQESTCSLWGLIIQQITLKEKPNKINTSKSETLVNAKTINEFKNKLDKEWINTKYTHE